MSQPNGMTGPWLHTWGNWLHHSGWPHLHNILLLDKLCSKLRLTIFRFWGNIFQRIMSTEGFLSLELLSKLPKWPYTPWRYLNIQISAKCRTVMKIPFYCVTYIKIKISSHKYYCLRILQRWKYVQCKLIFNISLSRLSLIWDGWLDIRKQQPRCLLNGQVFTCSAATLWLGTIHKGRPHREGGGG